MDINVEKVELVQMLLRLNSAKALAEVREMLETIETKGFTLSPEQKMELDQRALRHKNGESKSYSWEEVKADINKLRNAH